MNDRGDRPGDEELEGGPLGFGPENDDEGEGEAGREARVRAERERWAHRQDPDLLDEGVAGRPHERERIAVPRTAGASRYGWFLGVVLVLGLAYVSVNSFRSEGQSSRGLEAGGRLPAFAAPLATSRLEGDVNVATRPGQGDAGKVPACRLRGPDVLNVCQLWERGPVVLAFFATRGAQCTRELDALDDVRARHPGVQFAAMAIRGDRGDLRDLIAERRWRFPVGYDRDGILANSYGVAVCPQITYALPGGVVIDTSLGELGARGLDARVRALERRAREKGWRPPA